MKNSTAVLINAIKLVLSLLFLGGLILFACTGCGDNSDPGTSDGPVINKPHNTPNDFTIDWDTVPVTEVDLSDFAGNQTYIDDGDLDYTHAAHIEDIEKIDGVPKMKKVKAADLEKLYDINDNFLYSNLYQNANSGDTFTEILFTYKAAGSDIHDVLNKRIEDLKSQYRNNPKVLDILDSAEYEEYYNHVIFVISEHAETIKQIFAYFWDPKNNENPLSNSQATIPDSIPESVYISTITGEVLEVGEDYFIMDYVGRHNFTVYYDEEAWEEFPEVHVGDNVYVSLSGSRFIDTSVRDFEIYAFYVRIED